MAEDRPDKHFVRDLWADEFEQATGVDDRSVPVYLTLPGAHGRDLERLVDRGLIERMETGAIAADDAHKVVGIEKHPGAYDSVLRRFPGIMVLRLDVSSLLASPALITFPTGEHQRLCRARIVNLDFNGTLVADQEGDALMFPLMKWVEKFSRLHLKEPALDWSLCLTLSADIAWPPEVSAAVQAFLKENFITSAEFAAASQAVLGDDLFNRLSRDEQVDISTLSPVERQTVLMVVVPKRIITDTLHGRWRISTIHNLRYGGEGDHAAMVTWIFRFELEPRMFGEPQAVFRECLEGSLENVGRILADGGIEGR